MTTMEEILIGLAATVTAAVLTNMIFGRIIRRSANRPGGPGRLVRFLQKAVRAVTHSIFGVLGLGLVWTVYFLVVGLADPARTEWAANAATLIVSVLTVLSIMVAFYEFVYKGKKDKD